MQLLRITSVPMKYTMRVERPRLETVEQHNIKAQMTTQPAKLDIQSKNIRVRLDTYEARSSLGMKSVFDAGDEQAKRGLQAANEATGEYSEIGTQLAQIQSKANIPDVMYNKLFKQPTTEMVFLPSVGPQISWEANQMEMNYQPAKLDTQWQMSQRQVDFIPGDFTIDIEQYPKLEIEYLGRPTYVPPSADPEYEG